MSETTAATAPLPRELNQAIAALFMEGRRVSEVVAHGLTRQPGWRRNHVVSLLEARGWALDSEGRILRRLRSSTVPPVTPLPGGPNPGPSRGPVAEWPPEGTVTEGRGANAAAALIAVGKQHPTGRIQRLAEKAETALADLRAALKDDEQNAVLRNRLAEVEAEAARLRAQLGAKPRAKTGGGKRVNPAVTAATRAKPIDHGTWGGFLAETKRGLDHCQPCTDAKDTQLASMQAKSAQKRATQASAAAQDAARAG